MALDDLRVTQLAVTFTEDTSPNGFKVQDGQVRMQITLEDGVVAAKNKWVGDSGVEIQAEWFGEGAKWVGGTSQLWKVTPATQVTVREIRRATLEVRLRNNDGRRLSGSVHVTGTAEGGVGLDLANGALSILDGGSQTFRLA